MKGFCWWWGDCRSSRQSAQCDKLLVEFDWWLKIWRKLLTADDFFRYLHKKLLIIWQSQFGFHDDWNSWKSFWIKEIDSHSTFHSRYLTITWISFKLKPNFSSKNTHKLLKSFKISSIVFFTPTTNSYHDHQVSSFCENFDEKVIKLVKSYFKALQVVNIKA